MLHPAARHHEKGTTMHYSYERVAIAAHAAAEAEGEAGALHHRYTAEAAVRRAEDATGETLHRGGSFDEFRAAVQYLQALASRKAPEYRGRLTIEARPEWAGRSAQRRTIAVAAPERVQVVRGLAWIAAREGFGEWAGQIVGMMSHDVPSMSWPYVGVAAAVEVAASA